MDLWYAMNSWFLENGMEKQNTPVDAYAKPENQETDGPTEFPYTPEEQAEIAHKEATRQRPARRQIDRSGITKNKGRGLAKAKRKQAKLSRRKNRA